LQLWSTGQYRLQWGRDQLIAEIVFIVVSFSFLALDGDIIVERLHPEKPAVLLIILNMPRKHAWARGEEKDRLRAAYAEPLKRLANSPYPAHARAEYDTGVGWRT
jgi:hypothetical protein